MAVTTRKRVALAAAVPEKKAPSTPKKPAGRRSTTKTPVEAEPESESEDEQEQEESEEEDDNNDEGEGEEEEEEEEVEEEEEAKDNSDDEDTFKIHTPKTPAKPRVAPAALPSITYEDDSEDDDSDAAPEAESLSTAKAKILSAQDKEKSFLSKVQAEQKAKRVEREEKLKTQKEQSKKKPKTTTTATATKQPSDAETSETSTTTTRSGLPVMLPMDILESVAQMEASAPQESATTNDKKRKHMRPEDFALMELEAELRAEAQKRKKAEKTQKNVGPVTVKVLDQSTMAKGHAIPETIVDFRKQHFFGSKIQRKDAVLNMSHRNLGAATKFSRRK
ncbi:hypothetical protein BGZ99_007354 [Dissophora globulifera]|uniref:Uncharacterized protein n=1 Tax=Dissophora globulifera TaxID=979702 RepID=A0A9P6RBX2_9FUNG|nr:hypothetical protein BGZ99_007354 [Dissophora globulifera]